jgi:HPt (histidine-containing phosphotransfer) domain-containing protein
MLTVSAQLALAEPPSPAEVLPVEAEQLSDGPVSLRQWQVYRGLWQSPADAPETVWQQAPHRGLVPGLGAEALDVATYRRLVSFPSPGTWALFIPEPFGAAQVRVNGQILPTESKVGSTPETTRMVRGNLLHTFEVGDEPIEIAIEIASWYSATGPGLIGVPVIGPPDEIRRHQSFLVGLDQFMLGALFIMGFYHFALYLLRPEQKTNIFFSVYCLVVGFRSLFAGDGRYWAELFPQWAGLEAWKIELLCLYAAVPPLQYFMRGLFPREYNRWVPHGYTILSALFFLVTLVAALSTGWLVLPVFQVLLLGFACYGLYAVIMAFYRGRDGSGIFLLSALVLFVAVFNDVLEANGTIHSVKLITFGLLMFIFSNSFLISRRFSRAFTRVEETEKEIRLLNESLEQKVEEQTRDIKSILDNIQQGILTIVSAEDYRIGDDYSPFLSQILQTEDIASRNALDLLFAGTKVTEDQLSRMRTALDFAIGEMEWSWEGNADNFVREFRREAGQEQIRYFEIDWSPVINQGIIDKVLVTIRDVTSLKMLQKESRRRELDLESISEIVGVSPQKFEDLVHQATASLKENERLIAANTVYNAEALKIMFINYHTLKGVCRSYNMTMLASVIHEAEKALAQLQKDPKLVWDQQQLTAALERVESMFQKYITLSTEKLGRTLNSDQQVVIDRHTFEERIEELQRIDLSHLSKEESVILEKTMVAFEKVFYDSSKDVFDEILSPVNKLAKDLGKDEPVIEFADQGLKLERSQQKLFKNVFIHIIRNSLDHGIETAEERIRSGKSPAGKIRIELNQADDHIMISYADDGRGLNLQRLREMASERQLLSEDDLQDDHRVAELIFASGLSTANTVSQISGRGVGMGAVRQFVEDSGGRIEVRFRAERTPDGYRPFGFDIHLPVRPVKVA